MSDSVIPSEGGSLKKHSIRIFLCDQNIDEGLKRVSDSVNELDLVYVYDMLNNGNTETFTIQCQR